MRIYGNPDLSSLSHRSVSLYNLLRAANPPGPGRQSSGSSTSTGAEPALFSIPMMINVNASADKVWARIGKYCDIGEWGIPGCTILSGDGDMGTVRSIGNEILVGKTQYSYTYTQPVRVRAIYTPGGAPR
jgi:hypothetical protein